MNKIINKIFIDWRQIYAIITASITYSACWPFTKHRKRIQKFKETGHLKYLYKNESDKPCFAHDAAYSDSKDFAKGTISD